MRKSLVLGLWVAVSVIGCGGDESGTGGSGTASASASSGGTGGTGGATAASTSASTGSSMIPDSAFTVEFPEVDVYPGVEATQCVIKRLGNPEQIHVGAIINKLTPGSHHLIVYRTSDTEEQPEPFDCNPFSDTLDPTKGAPLMITQKEEEVLSLPTGVAFTLEANQMLRLEMHYLNASGGQMGIGATSSFVPVDNYTDEADFLFVGNPDIDIPPMSTFTLGPTYFPLPAMFDNVNVFALTGHTHQWGTNVDISIAQTKDGPDTKVYDVKDWQWSEPETVFQTPAFPMPPGGGFRFTCEYDNKGDKQVQFGESANDEMCFFWAYYYPSKGAFVCAHTDQIPGGFDLCCPGHPLCDQVF